MTGDRSGYRKTYLSILSYTEEDWQRVLELCRDRGQLNLAKQMVADSRKIHEGVRLPAWPSGPLLSAVQQETEKFCHARIDRGQELLAVPRHQDFFIWTTLWARHQRHLRHDS